MHFEQISGESTSRYAYGTVDTLHHVLAQCSALVGTRLSLIGTIHPRTDGGADIRPPRRFFVDSGKTAARSAAKFGMTISSSFLHMMCKF